MLKERLLKSLDATGAKGSFVVQALNKENATAEYQSSLVVPSASLIKVFVMIEVMLRSKYNALDINTTIPVKKEDVVGFSVLKFLEQRAYTLKELLNLMITYSDNTAANVLIDFLTIKGINASLKKLGYNNSILQRKMMDFKAAEEGMQNFTNVCDVSNVLKKMYKGRLLGPPYDELMLGIMKQQADECMMRRYLPDEIRIARKSGELNNLNHEMAIVYTPKIDYLYTFFVWEAKDNNASRELLAQTSKITFDYFVNSDRRQLQ